VLNNAQTLDDTFNDICCEVQDVPNNVVEKSNESEPPKFNLVTSTTIDESVSPVAIVTPIAASNEPVTPLDNNVTSFMDYKLKKAVNSLTAE
jgi:hypothetical protein